MENESITERRHAYIAHLFDEHKLDALIISRLAHIRYLTGFTGSDALLLATPRNFYFITDSRYAVQAADEVVSWKPVIAKRGLLEEVKKRNYLRNAKRVGFESKYTTHDTYAKLKTLFSGKRWKSLEVTFEPIMLQKDRYEIENIRKAIAVSEDVFNTILGMIKPGVSEKDIAAEITSRQRRAGAERDAFESIVASGQRSALPHGRASDKKINNNESIILDFGCVVNGYHCDITRTVAVGAPEPEVIKCHKIVREALERAAESLREGIRCSKVDNIARGYIKKSGYGEYFGHSLGHGIGLDIHELPRISPYTNEKFVADSVITIEPGIYIPGRFGIRVEDDVLITPDGYEMLTSLSRELITI